MNARDEEDMVFNSPLHGLPELQNKAHGAVGSIHAGGRREEECRYSRQSRPEQRVDTPMEGAIRLDWK